MSFSAGSARVLGTRYTVWRTGPPPATSADTLSSGRREGRLSLRPVDEEVAEKLLRHKVLALLRGRGLLSQEWVELLLSWRRSGFSVHNRVYVPAGDSQGLEALVVT